MKIRTVVNHDDVKKVLEVLGQNKDRRDLLIFKIMIFEGFKVGEIVGSAKRKRENNKWVAKIPTFPGLRVEDLTDKGVIMPRRNSPPEERVFKYPEVLHEIRDFIGGRKRGRIFSISLSRVEQLARYYARKAGLYTHDMVRPQMFVDFSRRFEHENLMQMLELEFTAEQLTRLIEKGEGLNVEFKERIREHLEFCETMVSFANTTGGYILIGVEDNGNINGVEESEVPKLEDRITGISQSYCDPSITFTPIVVPIKGTCVMIVRINEGTDKPYWLKEHGPMIRTGPRHGSRDRLMTRQEAEKAFRGSKYNNR